MMTPDSETRVQAWKFPIVQKFFGRDRAEYAHMNKLTRAHVGN
jgi:hypothetical protein